MEPAYIYFGEVAKLGSIRQAAERLYVSASAISRQIAKLEQDFDAPLLVRHAQGVKLTPAGQILVEFIQTRSREIQRLKAFIDDLKNLQRGHVTLYTVEGVLGGFLPAALAGFAAQYPGLTYDVVVSGSDEVMRAVAEANCDIGLSFHPHPRAGVKAVAEARQPLLVIMAPDHPLSRRSAVRLSDLIGVPLCIADKSFGIRHLIDHVIKVEPVSLSVRLETNSIEMMRQFAVQGIGVSFLPAYAFEQEARAGKLVGVPLSGAARAATQICTHAELDLTPAASMMLNALIEASQATLVLP